MKISYDRSIKLAGIGLAPLTRLGLERWFDNYQIVALHDTDAAGLMHMPPIRLLQELRFGKLNSQQIIKSDVFRTLAAGELAGYDFSTYRPVKVDDPVLRQRFVMSDPVFSKTYENKAWIREHLGSLLPFPAFTIHERSDLAPEANIYARLAAVGTPFVLQHEQLSGGNGTYIIKNYAAYCDALRSLPQRGLIVVSAFIADAKERSVQCCVTSDGVVVGALQKQLIREPLLCNTRIPMVQAFVGGEIGTVQASDAVQAKVRQVAQTIGQYMANDGYKGIFGIDFMIRGEEVYVLEVNARLTGLTPLLTMMCRTDFDVPFYLLHILELGGYGYEITKPAKKDQTKPAQGSLLLLRSHEDTPKRLTKTLASGVYLSKDGKLKLIRQDCLFADTDPQDALLVQQYAPVGEVVKPGVRLAAIMVRRPVLDSDDHLLEGIRQIVQQLYGHIVLDEH